MLKEKKNPLKQRLSDSAKKWSPLSVGLLLQEAHDRIKKLEEKLYDPEGLYFQKEI
jgi:hypothetical protein